LKGLEFRDIPCEFVPLARHRCCTFAVKRDWTGAAAVVVAPENIRAEGDGGIDAAPGFLFTSFLLKSQTSSNAYVFRTYLRDWNLPAGLFTDISVGEGPT
jgi:hypothetical protein